MSPVFGLNLLTSGSDWVQKLDRGVGVAPDGWSVLVNRLIGGKRRRRVCREHVDFASFLNKQKWYDKFSVFEAPKCSALYLLQ